MNWGATAAMREKTMRRTPRSAFATGLHQVPIGWVVFFECVCECGGRAERNQERRTVNTAPALASIRQSSGNSGATASYQIVAHRDRITVRISRL